MKIETVYNHFTKQDMYIGAKGRLFETRIDASDDIEAEKTRYYEELDYIAVELYGKRYNELSIKEYESVYHEYSKK